MKTKNTFLAVSILFFVLAVAFSLVFWQDVSLAATITYYACGFVSGILMGQWIARRSK